jgi:glycosyltransferase involved in cell wall biosynthesis
VILPVYNGEQYLHEAIDSVLKQSFKDFELIIIDDGSVDRSPEIIAKFASEDFRIVSVQRDNRGLVYSLNEGVSLAKSQYIARMDADDICLPDRLKKQYDYLKLNPNCGVVGSRVLLIDNEGEVVGRCHRPLSNSEIRLYLAYGNPFAHPAVMFSLNSLEKGRLKYQSSDFPSEDLGLWLRLSSSCTLNNIAEPLLKYRINQYGVSSNNRSKQIENNAKLRENYLSDDAFLLNLSRGFSRKVSLARIFFLLRLVLSVPGCVGVRDRIYLIMLLARYLRRG